ncbi:HNH endonuclease [Lysinibacillus fusiformis]|uniref:HNH endonuclease n=1 Tax=Lysinibacillus fusiformis TaxID=28031 RepID=UPI002EC3F050|nr:HNH endonuclease [Lysinibacillus fusiformis]
MAFSEEVCSEVLAKCARVCCICREFKPLHVQVHHIREKAEGGTDDLDNAIPLCIECHASVHTKSKMTKNFTKRELKKTRETVYEMVSMGRIPKSKSIERSEIESLSALFSEMFNKDKVKDTLSNEALEVLSTMLCERAPAVINIQNGNFIILEIGSQYITRKFEGKAQYPSFVLELLNEGLVHLNGNLVEITNEGENLVSKLVQTTATYTQKKIKCLDCSLHFVICTWNRERHNCSTIQCPECGQKNGRFLVWTQQKFGFIFEEVPGTASIYDFMGTIP